MSRWKVCAAVIAGIVLLSSGALAQPRPDESKSWFGHFKGSWDLTQGDAGEVLDDGWGLGGGVTYWPENWGIGLVLEGEYHDFDISQAALDALNDAIMMVPGNDGDITGGDYSTWSLTAGITWSPSRSGSGFYVVGGVGAYFWDAKATSTGLVYYPPVCNPWWWWCYPGGVGEGSIVRGSESGTSFGYYGGVGWAFPVGLDNQIYIEARYTVIDMSPQSTEFIPIAVGYRW